MSIHLIFCRAANGVIGRDNRMPWHLPEDMAHFRTLTTGHTVLMGRRTWESLPPRFRPLPGRRNLVVSRQPGFSAPGAQAFVSLPDALEAAAGRVWVMGGASIYAQALPLAQGIEETVIHADFEGDAFAPVIDARQWQEVRREDGESASGLRFSFVTWRRKIPAA